VAPAFARLLHSAPCDAVAATDPITTITTTAAATTLDARPVRARELVKEVACLLQSLLVRLDVAARLRHHDGRAG
jgi:hypothetical protein